MVTILTTLLPGLPAACSATAELPLSTEAVRTADLDGYFISENSGANTELTGRILGLNRFSRTEDSKKRWQEVDDLARQIFTLSPNDIALLRAGVIPPGTPAEALTSRMQPLIGKFVKCTIDHWHEKGVFLERTDIFPRTGAALVLFILDRHYNPQKSSLVHWVKKYFLSYLDRQLAKEHPVMQAHLKATMAVASRLYKKGEAADRERFQTELGAEREKRHLRMTDNELFNSEGDTISLWDMIPADQMTESISRGMVSHIADAVCDLLKDPHVLQMDKEVFVLTRLADNPVIGRMYGVTRQRIRQREARALTRFLHHMNNNWRTEDLPNPLYEKTENSEDVLRKLLGLLTPSELGLVMARAGFDRHRWAFLRNRFAAAVPPPPEEYPLTGFFPCLAVEQGRTSLRTVSPPPTKAVLPVAGFKTAGDFEILTLAKMEALSAGRAAFVLQGVRDKTGRLYRLRITDIDNARDFPRTGFSITIEKWILQNGTSIFWMTDVRGTHAAMIAAAIQKSGAVDLFISAREEQRKRVSRILSKGTRFKKVADLPTLTVEELAALAPWDSFYLAGKVLGEKIVGFRIVPDPLPRKWKDYFQIRVVSDKKTGQRAFAVTEASGGSAEFVLERLKLSQTIVVSDELLEAVRQRRELRAPKRNRFKTPSDLQTMLEGKAALLFASHDPVVLQGEYEPKSGRIIGLSALPWREGLMRRGSKRFFIKLKHFFSGRLRYRAVDVTGNHAVAILETLRSNGLFEVPQDVLDGARSRSAKAGHLKHSSPTALSSSGAVPTG